MDQISPVSACTCRDHFSSEVGVGLTPISSFASLAARDSRDETIAAAQ